MTKIDGACGETEKDLKNVYKSKHVKKKVSVSFSLYTTHGVSLSVQILSKVLWGPNFMLIYELKCFFNTQMTDFSAAVGIPLNYIFPVKNYCEEIDLKDDVDSLILSALRRMIDFGDDFINKTWSAGG